MRVRKYNRGGEIDSLLNYIKNTNKPVPAQSDATRVAAPAPPVNTTDRDIFEVNRMFERMTALEGEQKESGLPPDMYTGRVQTDLGAAAMTPIGDIADIAGGVTNFAEAKGVAQKALAAGETGAAMALVLAPFNLSQLKRAIGGLRSSGNTVAADYLDAITRSGSSFRDDVQMAQDMGLDVNDVEDVAEELAFLADEIEYRNNMESHPDADNARDLADALESNAIGVEALDIDNIPKKIGSFEANLIENDRVTWRDAQGNSVHLTVDPSYNPTTKRDQNVYSIDAFGFRGENAPSPSRVFVEAITNVPVGSTMYSSSMSVDSYPLFLKFLSGRRGRTPKAVVDTDFPINYSSLNNLGGKAQSDRLEAGGKDSFFGLTKDQIDRISEPSGSKEDFVDIKAAVDKKLSEAGLPESKIHKQERTYSPDYYELHVPYPHITRTAEGFKYGGFLRIKKKKDKNKKFNIKRFK